MSVQIPWSSGSLPNPVKGLWNVGPINLPDFSISEMFNFGPRNSEVALGGKPNPLQTNTTMTINGKQVPIYVEETPMGPPSPTPEQRTQMDRQITTQSPPSGPRPTNSNSIPSWLKPGQQFSDQQGVWQMNSDGSLQFMGTHEERAKTQQAEQQKQLQAQIDEAYGPAMNAWGNLENTLRDVTGQQTSALENQYNTYMERLPAEQAQKEAEIKTQEQAVGDQSRSAYDQAVRAFNALTQQGLARFGTGSSTGGAIGELAKQEFARQQGQVNQQTTMATQQLNQYRQKVSDYITQKTDDLKMQKDQAIQQLNQNLQQQLAQIGLQKGQTEEAKAQMKLQVLQDTINQSRQIEAQDQQIRLGLVNFGLQNLANVSGQALDPQEIMGFAQQFGLRLPNIAAPTDMTTQVQNLVGGNILRPNNNDQIQGGNIFSSNRDDQNQ